MSPPIVALRRVPLWMRTAAVGLWLGFALSRIGFTRYGELQRMFTFEDLRLIGVFGGGVLGTAALLAVLRPTALAQKPIHPGTIPGALLFGVGWALCGACPGAALAAIGEGQWLQGGVAGLGIAIGTVAYRTIHRRYFSWDRGGCG